MMHAHDPHPIVASAGRLVSALLYNRDEDFRLALLKRVARRLSYCLNPPTHYAFA